ncbi:EscR/YscR/HrcR family type III secretion system export apparatus protein [Dyella monticola]|uniref:EscR/YscR/HrcR family type III secretion system export apparatus protein n=2 Tax=Dyella monticola TaxID=1927958 RepID=A0A370X466_9GAMM|nr:EscR/YscR/HrcR family type III secretion system export apparatus protein [Dyella monticola]
MQVPDIPAVLIIAAVLGLLPLIVVMTTSFTKISIVLVLLRNALGVQQAPSGMAISGLAMAATLMIMAPVWQQIASRLDIISIIEGHSKPMMADVMDATRAPLEAFMRKHVDGMEFDSLQKLVKDMHFSGNDDPADASAEHSDEEGPVLVAAFTISEIAQAFKIGMFLSIGFAVIDLIVANLLMAMGMSMFPPSTVSVPLKLLVFVTTTGLSRLMHSLIASYPP